MKFRGEFPFCAKFYITDCSMFGLPRAYFSINFIPCIQTDKTRHNEKNADNTHTPVQMVPFPTKPLLQTHEYEPTVL